MPGVSGSLKTTDPVTLLLVSTFPCGQYIARFGTISHFFPGLGIFKEAIYHSPKSVQHFRGCITTKLWDIWSYSSKLFSTVWPAVAYGSSYHRPFPDQAVLNTKVNIRLYFFRLCLCLNQYIVSLQYLRNALQLGFCLFEYSPFTPHLALCFIRLLDPTSVIQKLSRWHNFS